MEQLPISRFTPPQQGFRLPFLLSSAFSPCRTQARNHHPQISRADHKLSYAQRVASLHPKGPRPHSMCVFMTERNTRVGTLHPSHTGCSLYSQVSGKLHFRQSWPSSEAVANANPNPQWPGSSLTVRASMVHQPPFLIFCVL